MLAQRAGKIVRKPVQPFSLPLLSHNLIRRKCLTFRRSRPPAAAAELKALELICSPSGNRQAISTKAQQKPSTSWRSLSSSNAPIGTSFTATSQTAPSGALTLQISTNSGFLCEWSGLKTGPPSIRAHSKGRSCLPAAGDLAPTSAFKWAAAKWFSRAPRSASTIRTSEAYENEL